MPTTWQEMWWDLFREDADGGDGKFSVAIV